MLIGNELAKAGISVAGVDIVGDPEWVARNVLTVANACASKLKLQKEFAIDEIQIVPGYAGHGYGLASSSMIEAVKQLAQRASGKITDRGIF